MAYGKRLQRKSDKKAHIKSLGTFWKWSLVRKEQKMFERIPMSLQVQQ